MNTEALTTILTYKFRVHDTAASRLGKMAGAVNWVWNYANEVSMSALDYNGRWLSGYDLQRLAKGASSELGILRETIDAVLVEYATRRAKAKRRKLSWRSRKRSLGWLPFKRTCFSISGDTIRYGKHHFRIWKSREVVGTYKCGSFSQDARGRWYVNIVCEVPIEHRERTGLEVGIDLGLKTIATLSDGGKLERVNIAQVHAKALATAQRARKVKRTRSIHARIQNARKDWAHKTTTNLVQQYDFIAIGNVSSSKLKKTRMAKSVSDAGWSQLRTMLAYKAVRLGVVVQEVNENGSTVTCSACGRKTGPSGLSALGVRNWSCQCGASHDRDVNAAINILSRAAHGTPITGAAAQAEMRIP